MMSLKLSCHQNRLGDAMSDIKEYMIQDHRYCDEIFVQMEDAVSSKSDEALSRFEVFQDALTNHFKMEEMVLFPMFEQKTGMSEGPTQVMVMEHEQMRKLLSNMEDAVESNDNDKFFSLSETLMILMQQHNMKEEQMLYTMIQQHLGDDADHIISRMRMVTL
jgi:hemerythrin-like domain-containing protein